MKSKTKDKPEESDVLLCRKCVEDGTLAHFQLILLKDVLFVICREHQQSPLCSVDVRLVMFWDDDEPKQLGMSKAKEA